MTVTTQITILDGQLLANGRVILSEVPENVVLTPSSKHGAFLGVSSSESNSSHVFPLGLLKDRRFLGGFRFKLWWMTQRMGMCGRDVAMETQFLLVESKDRSPLLPPDEQETVYVLFLPILDAPFRAALQGNPKDQLEVFLESGDKALTGYGGSHIIYLHTGLDPFKVMREAWEAMEMLMQTFHRREDKKIPGLLDVFGWCTWNALYTNVTAKGVRQGLQSLEEGGTPARFIIIDDGWQSVDYDYLPWTDLSGSSLNRRLQSLKANYKFQRDGQVGEEQCDLHDMVQDIKEKHGIKYVYVWHALIGYWCGISTGGEMEQYEATIEYPIYTPGILHNEPNLVDEAFAINGIGLARPSKAFQFFDELHTYLAGAGVDGVKIDITNVVECLGTGLGGRVSLMRQFLQALEDSVAQNFPDNGCIFSMSHSTEVFYSIKNTAVMRASDDFWPQDPASHTVHIASIAYNSFFLGELMQLDWDMFQSTHLCAEYHAAARAVGGCPVYVSDEPGNHNFDLIKKLVLPDGSILRAQFPGRPTRDCLFNDPARDGKSLLKIWNLNKHTGVIGVFNCQGAGWSRVEKAVVIHDVAPGELSGSLHTNDVELLSSIVHEGWSGDCAVYSHRGGGLVRLPLGAALPITLDVLKYELFTISPIKRLSCGLEFAPVGLLQMFNSGGSIVELEYKEGDLAGEKQEHNQQAATEVCMKVRGPGEFGAYSSKEPRECLVNNISCTFAYDTDHGAVKVALSKLKQDVVFIY